MSALLVMCFGAALSAQELPAPTDLTAVRLPADDPACVDPMCIAVSWAYDWTQVALAGGDEYGFDLERATCAHVEPPPCSEPGPFAVIQQFRWVALLGDCAFDRRVDLLDALRSIDVMLGVVTPTPAQGTLCDVDCSGAVDVIDVLRIVDDVVGVAELPSACTVVGG